ncbi:unnamed protein product [Schistosoma turkestanicum]|nr:unnamed protein product [Schistosoma turkestanicum]
MSFREKANLNSAQAFLHRSKSLYDGTKSTMRLSSLTSKLRTVSETLANTNPFSARPQNNSIAEEDAIDIKQAEGIKKVKRRTRKRITSTNESSTSASGNPDKLDRRKRKKKPKCDCAKTDKPVKNIITQQTTEYVVQEGDSLNSVAARFDLTPSELCRVNKFLSRTLFVGQVIKLPFNEKVANMTVESTDKLIEKNDSTNTNTEKIQQSTTETISSAKSPLDLEKGFVKEEIKSNSLQSVDSLTSSVNETDTDEQDLNESSTYSEYTDYADEENDPMACQYLKFDCKYVVDLQNSVPGIILVTTNMFVFKPYDEEQYPLENHCKQIPLNQFRTIAVYRDPSVMYFTKREAQLSSSSDNVLIDCNVEDSAEQTPSVIITKDDKLSNPIEIKESTNQLNSSEIEQKDIENMIITDDEEIQNNSSASNMKCDLDNNPFYLCILASMNSMENNRHKRHPHWFTIQSEEYWFIIPNEKSKILLDFLLTCQFHGHEDDIEQCTNMESSQLSIKSTEIKATNKISTITSKLHSKSLGNLYFFKSSIKSPISSERLCLNDDGSDVVVDKFDEKTLHDHHHQHQHHKHTHLHHKHYHFVVVPSTFDWVLPRIGTSDDHSRSLVILKNQQKHASITKDPPKISHDQIEYCQPNELEKPKSAQESTAGSSFKDTTDIDKSIEKYDSIPSMEEEKAALKLLKRETVDWELVSSKELELKDLEEEKKKQFIFDCIKLAEPELLPIPTATSNSEIFNVQKVRDLLQNLTPDAEGLDWMLTYSTSMHGFSLKSLYRRCANSLTDSSPDKSCTKMKYTHTTNSPHAANQPCILIIRTSTNEIFGAMLNTHPYPSNGRFYGNGSCFVFRWLNTNDLKDDQVKEKSDNNNNNNSPNEQDSIAVSLDSSNKLMNVASDMNPASSSSSSSLLVKNTHGGKGVIAPSSSFTSFDMKTELVTKEFAHLSYHDEKELLEQNKKETFQKFIWSGKNSYFINGGHDSLTIGCSQGHSAIQLDDVLLHGHSDSCETFDSPQLTSTPDFIITALEIWSFI